MPAVPPIVEPTLADPDVARLYDTGLVPPGHAAGRVVGVDAHRVYVAVGDSYLAFRVGDMPRFAPGDLAVFGPSVTRWRLSSDAGRRCEWAIPGLSPGVVMRCVLWEHPANFAHVWRRER
jgi:hypothetical protein